MLKVFLVEDNPVILQNLTETLTDLVPASIVGSADSERDALHWLEEGNVDWDLAVVDLFLVQGSGLGVLTGIAHRPPSRKVVVLSNYATADIRRRCTELGADAVFDKSSELDEFITYCTSVPPHAKV